MNTTRRRAIALESHARNCTLKRIHDRLVAGGCPESEVASLPLCRTLVAGAMRRMPELVKTELKKRAKKKSPFDEKEFRREWEKEFRRKWLENRFREKAGLPPIHQI